MWNTIKKAVHNSAVAACGKQTEKMNNDWYNENAMKLEPFMEAKHQALQAYKDQPSRTTLATLRAARNQARSMVRECVNAYWNRLDSSIQQASDTGHVKAMFNGIKRAVGPSIAQMPH